MAMATDPFQTELESFLVHMPGGGKSIQLTNDEAMEAQMVGHYGDWRRKPGSVTPIPLVRIPRIFLRNSEMPEFFKKRFKSLQTGEQGEMRVFNCVRELSSLKLDVGLALFPNVDSQCFKNKDVHVEIDMILIHPVKGIFIFNVKNTEKIIAEKDIVPDVKKHGDFIRRLCQDNQQQLPIYTIVCSLKKTLNEKFQDSVREQIKVDCCPRDTVFFFNQPEITIKDFSSNWQEKVLSQVCDLTEDERKLTDRATVRLFGMNIMTGSLFQIHKKFVQSNFQKMKKNEKDFDRMTHEYAKAGIENSGEQSDESVARLKEDLVHLSTLNESPTASATEDTSQCNHVILWTEEQIRVIAEVMKRLHQGAGSRLVIEGCKGSGKTLIMSVIAVLARNIHTIKHVLIGDGRLGESLISDKRLPKRENLDFQISCLYLGFPRFFFLF